MQRPRIAQPGLPAIDFLTGVLDYFAVGRDARAGKDAPAVDPGGGRLEGEGEVARV
ncbi:MAG TPA: hypothetical protein VM120_08540 [Bryobacteraceae bacterium]|nr:hypothetical protein [Bryobacteraceae bacterium]